ncbi:MAG TPA: hypothetical protein VGH36_04475 [Acetobacteraceae bacterium]
MITLTCDAPGCGQTVQRVQTAKNGLVIPLGWWVQNGFGRVVCGCTTQHLNEALKAETPGTIGTGTSP